MQGEDEHSHEHKTDFDDSEVKDRTLSEWNGSWQSTNPLLLDGSLDEVWEYKAENDDTMTAEDYKKKYTTAYETDVVTINIDAPTVEYVTADKTIKADYDYSGFYIRTKDDGSKQVRYKFEKKSGDDEAAKYIVFSDHNIEPSEPEHFHLYSGNDGFDTLVEEGEHFPTYYPSDLTAEDIVDELTGGHKHEQEEEEEEYDEHVWLSLKNAEVLCAEIEKNIEEIDPANADDYKANLDSYVSSLSELDNSFQTLVDSASVKTLVFGDRFPFRYFVDDYGLDYFAAFIGCSAESEASFETVKFLADKINELDCDTVFTLENSNKDIANSIIANSGKSGIQIAELNSLQSVSKNDISSGASYISLMQKNYDVLASVMK
jgi:zinc transport system substrate-binding protein